MTTSDSLAQLGAALAAAQGEMSGAAKDALNPHFKSKYADLASVWDACRGPLSKHGLSVVQLPRTEGKLVTVTTVLLHASGERIACDISAPSRDEGPQAVGSVITYLRRYGLSALVGVAPEDDDAEQGENRGRFQAQSAGAVLDTETGEERPPAPAGYHYVAGYRISNGWHEAHLLNYDAQGGSLKVSTKRDFGALLNEAQREGRPVRVKTSEKKGAVGEAYLSAIETLKPAPAPSPISDAEALAAAEVA